LQRAGRRNPMTHENAEDLTANVLVGRSVRHRSTIGFARHRSYGRTATVDKIEQPDKIRCSRAQIPCSFKKFPCSVV
jgi:hypothetical protein